MPEVDFQVMYKEERLNQQADALSLLLTLTQTVTDDWDEVPAYLMEEHTVEKGTKPKKCPHPNNNSNRRAIMATTIASRTHKNNNRIYYFWKTATRTKYLLRYRPQQHQIRCSNPYQKRSS